jgi:Sulfotransferase family
LNTIQKKYLLLEMPYFECINLLFIHIPKTGGTSVEKYLSKKFNIQLNEKSLYGVIPWEKKKKFNLHAITFQHLILRKLMNLKYYLGIKELPCILTIVRNPYERLISDLFYFNLIHKHSNQTQVYHVIKHFLAFSKKYDNHPLPQHTFLLDERGQISKTITILKTETLQKDMQNFGFTDFDMQLNVNNSNKEYYQYLSEKSIHLINYFYHKDFSFFGYKKLSKSQINLNKNGSSREHVKNER